MTNQQQQGSSSTTLTTPVAASADAGRRMMIPLPLLFAKPSKDQVRLSPLGTWLAYRSRSSSSTTTTTTTTRGSSSSSDTNGSVGGGVLNLWIQNIKTGQERQLTFETERDVCIRYWFTYDDKSIVFLREYPKLGSEIYHLFAIDLNLNLKKDENGEDGSTSTTTDTPRDLILGQQDPTTTNTKTCAMGFAGGLQVWLDPEQPRVVYTSVAPCGIRSMFWNIQRIHIDTLQTTTVAYNPLSTWKGLILFALCTIFEALLRKLLNFSNNNNVKKQQQQQPRATVQWFPDQQMKFRGRLELSLIDLSCAWRVLSATEEDWKTIHCVQWKDANMSLVGSTGGSGTAHFDFRSTSKSKSNKYGGGKQQQQEEEVVDVHLCNVMDTTSYERCRIGQNEDDDSSRSSFQQLASHPKSDITGFIKNPKTNAVEAVIFDYEKPTIHCLQEEDCCPDDVRDTIAFLQKEFSNNHQSSSSSSSSSSISIVSRTLDDSTWLIHVQSDVGIKQCLNAPSGYFVVYRKEGKEPSYEFLLSSQPDLANYALGSMAPVHIQARDGEDLLCYLHQPPPPPPEQQQQQQKSPPPPLVLLIHGGPQARDVYRFNPVCQLLCSRGMAVLQVNYRGSTGMGSRFMKLGMNGAFAKGVPEDIQDAANHAIAKGWCNPNKMAIMGGSFGGYLSLAAMTNIGIGSSNSRQDQQQQQPDYKCAVAICPPSIMGAANPHKAFYGNPIIAKYWKQVYGEDISSNIDASKAVSPLFHMDKMSRPLLLLHGQDDPRVPIEQTNDLYNQLLLLQQQHQQQDQSNNKECEYIRFAGEGHGINKEQNILYMYHKIECFLCRHLGLPGPPKLEGYWYEGHTGTQVSGQKAQAVSEESQKSEAGKNKDA